MMHQKLYPGISENARSGFWGLFNVYFWKSSFQIVVNGIMSICGDISHRATM